MNIVFDLDGTLIDSAPDIAAALNVGFARNGWPELEARYVERFIGNGPIRLIRDILEDRGIAATELDGEKSLLANPFFRRKVAELEMDLTALEFTELRTLAGEAAGKGPGPESSVLKIKGSEIQQRLTELTLEMAGHYGAPYFRGFGEGDNEHPIGPGNWANRAAPTYFNTRKTTIYGGSNEIQRNIIAKMVLGL